MRCWSIALVLLVAVPATALDQHAWSRPFRAASRAYIVETNTYPELAQALCDQLSEAHALYEDRFGPLRGKARRPMLLRLYRTQAEYMELGNGVKGAVGHFDPALDRCAIVWRGDIGERGWPVSVHEACHHYFRRRFPALFAPSWYSEGIACWFEGALDPSADKAVSRLRIRAAKAARRSGGARLETVLAGRAEVVDGKLRIDGLSPARFYGLAWSLVHFLVTDARYRRAFRRFELRLFATRLLPGSRERVTRRLLEEECGPLKTLERDWLVHLDTLKPPRVKKKPPVYQWELEAERPFVRYAALYRLEGAALPASIRPQVVAALQDGDLPARLAACRALARAMGPDAVPGMVAALDAGDRTLKQLALRALRYPGAQAAVPRLLREHVDVELAIRALAEIGDPRSFGLLRQAVNARRFSSVTRARCAAALARDPRSAVALARAELDAAPAVRNAARKALIRMEREKEAAQGREEVDAERIDDMISVLRNPFAKQREVKLACKVLIAVRARRAVPDLKRLCRPRIPDSVRLHAVRALVAITGETRGFASGQPARAREAAFRAWARSD
ncbi:MAG: hypothetical protein OER88_02860 [Planctomycetota bacterium]|nr:hypothetical protein [Planctomycetota bacterium]